jgi:hypothetical protein
MTPQEQFTTDLKRILYLQEILQYSQEAIKSNPLTPSWFKTHINNSINGATAFKNSLMVRSPNIKWDKVNSDLTDDRLHDLALHIDFIAPIRNIAEITEVLQNHTI